MSVAHLRPWTPPRGVPTRPGAGARTALLVVLAWCAAIIGMASAGPGPVLRDLAVVEDPSASMSVTEVSRSTAFQPVHDEGLARGYTRSAWWLRFTVEAPAGEWWLDLLPAFLDEVRLYEPQPDGAYTERRTGDALPFSTREVEYRGFVFKLRHTDAQPRTYLLRIRTSSTLAALPRIVAPAQFFPRAGREQALFPIIPAVLLAIVMLKAATWVHVRDSLVLWFLGYITCLQTSVGAAAGLWSMYVTPELPAVNHYVTGIATLAATALGHAFYRRLFGITRADGWPYWIYAVATWGTALATVLFAVTGDNVGVTGRGLATVPLMNAVGLLMAARAWRRGAPGGAPMLAANIITMVTIGAYSLLMMGLIWNRAVFLYALPVSALGSMLALDLALAARIGAIDHDRRLALAEVARGSLVREQQARFIDLVSHEYRTPLAVLQTNLDILAMSDDEEERRTSADRMRIAVTRLRDLFTSAQRVSLDLANHRHLEVTTIDAAAAVCEAVTEMDGLYPTTRFALELGCGPAAVCVDRELLKIVLRNVLENAAKYGVPGVPVDVRITRDDERLEILIANDCTRGPGLPPEALLRGYSRGANATGQPGLGIGLHLSQRLAGEMGATLHVDLPTPRRFEARVGFPVRAEADA